ncbi:glycoside hydrolase family 31 protein [Acidaminobacter sp. JC074]|uniref:glycoside hydrolase family 31 protein n=1 Tax=Acidaminobacter sp. JC074 TaxID=2530199 RepID=UPI001F0DFD89|nr:glycoside hydrolase family 31 protein [Acidaminobacter sp. JC074]
MINKEIQMLENEKWWCGCISHGSQMPLDNKSNYDVDLYNHATHNQVMPLMLSSKGRVIWSDSGFRLNTSGGKMSFESHTEIELTDTRGNLMTAYRESKKYKSSVDFTLDETLFKVPQYNSWIELMYNQSEDELLKYAQSILDEGYDPGILMIDDNWQEDYGVWEFSGSRFRDPKGMIDKMKKMGFKVMLWVCPFVSPDSLTFRQLRDKDYFIKNADGTTAIREWWNGYSAVLDFTNPEAYKWFKEKLDGLMDDYGVVGFKFDAGDLWNYKEDDITYKKISPLDQVKLYSEFCSEYEYNELRTGFKTAGLPLTQRLCDKHHNWESDGVGGLLPDGILQSMMGFDYNCPDMIGGGEYLNFIASSLDLDEELVVRYAQIAALFPIMQFSVSPWRVLSKENNDLCLQAAKIHQKFGDYIIESVHQSIKDNLPLMRHMALMYPENNYEHLNEQFMLGDNLLVAPVVSSKQYKKTVYFPQGRWTGDDGSIVEGPCEKEIQVPIGRLAYYTK